MNPEIRLAIDFIMALFDAMNNGFNPADHPEVMEMYQWTRKVLSP